VNDGEIARLDWLTDADIFRARQRTRDIAAAVGLDRQDQVRVATALSELGRELFTREPATVCFRIVADLVPRLLIELSAPLPKVEDTATPGTGIEVANSPARRLVDSLEVRIGSARIEVTLTKELRRGHIAVLDLEAVRRQLRAADVQLGPLEQLRIQNADLIETLEELRRRQHELAGLNEELASTNQGVLAMYTTLSAELDQTNRGVVALYAELDARGQQLADANEAKSRFLRNVSHELRAPINSILGLGGLLLAGQLDPEQRRQVDYVLSSGRSLLNLVNELLDLARAESDQLGVAVGKFELAALLGELAATLRPLAINKEVELVVEEPEIDVLVTDGDLLTRVLRNLLTNALAFTEHGRIRVRTTADAAGREIRIAVGDTGIGIATEHVGRVFEEFFQVPSHLQTQRHGTGLGLPYARRVTQALGGRLELESVLGLGSTFTVVLPMIVEERPDHPSDLRVGHVLVADDDPAFRYVVRGMLDGLAEQVSEAGDGTEAIAQVTVSRPDLLLLDLRMPNLGGAEVYATLRNSPDPALRDLPTILMTSMPIDDALRPAVEPAAALLSKSDLDRATLARMIAAVLTSKEQA
jgi:signal transduction histidine kinase